MSDDDITIRFGRACRKLRKRTGLSQEAFAIECGLDRTYISGIERGVRNVSLRNIERLAEYFDVTLAKLFRLVERE